MKLTRLCTKAGQAFLGVIMAILTVTLSVGIMPTEVHAQGGAIYGEANSDIDGRFGAGNVAGRINVAGGTEGSQGDSLINVIKNLINYALGFIGLIVLIFLLYGGFTIITAGEDETAYTTGRKIVKNAAIGIAFIGLAWFIVSFIFFVFDLVAGPGQ